MDRVTTGTKRSRSESFSNFNSILLYYNRAKKYNNPKVLRSENDEMTEETTPLDEQVCDTDDGIVCDYSSDKS